MGTLEETAGIAAAPDAGVALFAEPEPPADDEKRVKQRRVRPKLPAAPLVDAEALRKAIAERSPALEPCGEGNGADRVHARLGISEQGTVKSVALSPTGPVSSTLSRCIRETVRGWQFKELRLRQPVEVVVTFNLSPAKQEATASAHHPSP